MGQIDLVCVLDGRVSVVEGAMCAHACGLTWSHMGISWLSLVGQDTPHRLRGDAVAASV